MVDVSYKKLLENASADSATDIVGEWQISCGGGGDLLVRGRPMWLLVWRR